MGEDRPLEVIKLNLEQDIEISKLSYRVYVKDFGWTGWVFSGGIAGILGSGKPIEVFKAKFNFQQIT